MFCQKCGANIKDDSAFCQACGSRVEVPQPENQYGYIQPGFTQPPTYTQPGFTPPHGMMQPGVKTPKKKSSAILAAAVSVLAVAAVFIALMLGGVIHFGDSKPADQHDTSIIPAVKSPPPTAESVVPTEEPEYTDEITNDELIDYFCAVALDIEYGSGDGVVKRWEAPIRVQVSGDYTSEDYATLKDHISALNGLGTLPSITITDLSDSSANYFIYFVPRDEMGDVLPGYVEGNDGFFYIYWDGNYVINKAYMGIATDVTSQEARNHLILEEFTQTLGLTGDSSRYEDSIFQQKWTETQALSDIDWELLRMLYSNNVSAGMKQSEVISALS